MEATIIIYHTLNQITIENSLHRYYIEQNNYDKYNNGLLYNIGVYIANKQHKYKKFIFIDSCSGERTEALYSNLLKYNGYQNGIFEYQNKDILNIYKKDGISEIPNLYIKINNRLINNPIVISTLYMIDFLAFHTKDLSYIFKLSYVKNYIIKNNLKYPTYFINTLKNNYISYIEPLITWEEIKYKILDTYTYPILFTDNRYKMSKYQKQIKTLINNEFTPYSNLKYIDLENTLKFIYENFNEILYFRIRNNNLECAYHIYSQTNSIDWYRDLKYKNKPIDESIIDILEDRGLNYYSPKNPHNTPVTGNLIKLENFSDFRGNPISYVENIFDMIKSTILKYKNVPDCDLLINRKDFPYLRKDDKYAYIDLIDDTIKDKPPNWYPIGCQSKTNENLDIPIPTSDEWEYLKTQYKYNKNWEEKKNVAIFRGSGTGYLPDDENKRIKLSELAYVNKDILNVGLIKLNNKIKVFKKNIHISDKKKYEHLILPYVSSEEQSNYKYIFNIEGNSQSYRYGTEFKKKSVIINIVGNYYMWFEKLLIKDKQYIKVEDIKDTISVMNKLMTDDSKSKKIAKNGYKFSKRYISKSAIMQYWYYYFLFSNEKMKY